MEVVTVALLEVVVVEEEEEEEEEVGVALLEGGEVPSLHLGEAVRNHRLAPSQSRQTTNQNSQRYV